MRKKIVIEVLNDAPFGAEIEINKDVAAEDDVQALHEDHARIVRQVEPRKSDALTNELLHLQLICGRSEIFLAVVRRQVPRAVSAIDGIFRVRQRAFVEISGEDFDSPVFELALRLFEQQHAERIRFFPSRASRAPYAEPAQRQLRLRLENFGEDDVAQGIELRLVSEEAGLPNRDFV